MFARICTVLIWLIYPIDYVCLRFSLKHTKNILTSSFNINTISGTYDLLTSKLCALEVEFSVFLDTACVADELHSVSGRQWIVRERKS